MNLSSFLGVTPDTIIKQGTPAITFFYIPKTGEVFSDRFKTHKEMLEDEDSEVFDAVYPKLMDRLDQDLRDKGLRGAKLDAALEKELAPYKSRGRAANVAVLGRFGTYGNDPVVAVWRPVGDPQVKPAIEALMNKFPQLKQMTGQVIVTGADGQSEAPEGKPIMLSKLFGGPTGVQRAIPDLTKQMGLAKLADYDVKKYNIGGGFYSIGDLAKLRGATHTKKNYDPSLPSDPLGILCHPDMKKYPELADYIPNCPGDNRGLRPTHPAVWRQQARDVGVRGVYDYGEFVKRMDVIHDNKQ